MPKRDKLTEKQRRFVEAYMGKAAGNGTEAARIAGYKGNTKTLQSVATENLSKPVIAAAIQERVRKDPGIAKRKDRQRFWTDVMNSPETEMKDRLKASELLGRSQRDFVERRELSGPNGKPIKMHVRAEDMSDDELAAVASGKGG